LPEEELKAERPFQHNHKMVKLESLKKSYQFKQTLKEKKVHSEFFSIFAVKNFYKPKYKEDLIISFVMKKKIGNAVKRNKIRRKLKAIVQKLLKKKGAISKDYTYIVFGKSNAYLQKQSSLMLLMEKSFNTIKIK
jgi:ribonuclease P protein component